MPHGKVAWKRGVEIAAWPSEERRKGSVFAGMRVDMCMHV